MARTELALTNSCIGPTADAHSGSEAVFEEARQFAGRCAEGARDRDQRLRISRRQGSSLYLLAITFDGYSCRTSEYSEATSSPGLTSLITIALVRPSYWQLGHLYRYSGRLCRPLC